MTLYGWDASQYDGTLTTAVLARAKAEGIAFFTHKIGEGTGYDDPGDLTALAAARDAGIRYLAGYGIPRTPGNGGAGSIAAQVDHLVALADRDEPWWRDWPDWCWQDDLERWGYDQVSAADGIEYGHRLRDKTGRQVLLYASHGQYGDQLAGWDGPLWNAHYTSRAAAGFRAMYPGDTWMPVSGGMTGGWAPYSGRAPDLLQYTSSATIAGLTTCDANAFRGSADQLRALWRGNDMDLSDKVSGTDNNGRTVGDVLTDLANLRNWLITPFGQTTFQPAVPLAGSPLDLLAKLAETPPGTVDLDALAAKLAALMPKPPTAVEVAAEILGLVTQAKG